jgi:hypothetical protein
LPINIYTAKLIIFESEQQLKTELSGLKNLKLEEWIEGKIPSLQNRTLEGKESNVCLNGVELGYKRIKTASDRYSSKVSEDLGVIDTSRGK